jgi:hypothetical protein
MELVDTIREIKTPLALAALLVLILSGLFHMALKQKRTTKLAKQVVFYIFILALILGLVAMVGYSAQEVHIVGRVTDKNERGILGAMVFIGGEQETRMDTTLESGEFDLTLRRKLSARDYELRISSDGYLTTNVTISGPNPRPVPVTLLLASEAVPVTNSPSTALPPVQAKPTNAVVSGSRVVKPEVKVEEVAKLLVEFAYVHVYLDGSPGKDNWTVWGEVNDKKSLIWNRKKDISDNCDDQLGRGPGGDRSACQYSLGKSVPITIKQGEVLSIAFGGMANDQHDEVPRSQENFSSAQSWGVGGRDEKYEIAGKKYRRMGGVNRGQTEYYMYYRVIKP